MMYTPQEARGKGFATDLIAHIADYAVNTLHKRFCAIATDLANPTANGIYAKVGFVPRADFDGYALV